MDDYDPVIFILLGLGIGIPLGLAVFWLLSQGSSQHNLESWKVIRNENGMPDTIEVHRSVE